MKRGLNNFKTSSKTYTNANNKNKNIVCNI